MKRRRGNPNPKLTSELVRALRADRCVNLSALARHLGVDRKALRKARDGATWRRLGPGREASIAIALVAHTSGLPVARVIGPAKGGRQVVLARQTAMYLMAVDLELSQEQVARVFGRDRTTVSHALGRIEDQRDDPRFDGLVARLERVIRPRGLAVQTRGVGPNA